MRTRNWRFDCQFCVVEDFSRKTTIRVWSLENEHPRRNRSSPFGIILYFEKKESGVRLGVPHD